MTNLSTAVESSLTSIRAIGANIARLQEEAKAARKSAIEPFLDALAASGEVSLIVIYGYTPGFNDGEPCEHSAELVVNIEQAAGEDLFDRGVGLDGYDYGWAKELRRHKSWNRNSQRYDIDEGTEKANIELCNKHGHVYGEPSESTKAAIRDVIFETAEEENSTNYYVTYVLKDGKFVVESGEYDCGY